MGTGQGGGAVDRLGSEKGEYRTGAEFSLSLIKQEGRAWNGQHSSLGTNRTCLLAASGVFQVCQVSSSSSTM